MISSVISHYPEFHNFTDFKHNFKKRPFDVEGTAKQIHNPYKKIKTTTSSANSSSPQQSPHSPFSLRMGTNYSSPFDLSRYINLKDDENSIETNSFSDIPRIIDLSTGEPLESIPSVEQLQKNRKPKRPIELVENQDELPSILENMEEDNDDLIDENLLCPHKRIRTSREYMGNFIEEEEKIDTRVHGRIIDVVNDVPLNKVTVNFTERSQSSQSLSQYVHGKHSSNIKFTTPYQEAMTRYMRSQFQHLNNEEYENEGKQIVLYHPRNRDYSKESFVENNNDTKDENSSYDGQNGVREDHMDID